MTMNTQTHRTLGAIVKQTDQLAAVRKNDLRFGDRVVVTTRNSTYSIQVLKNGQYAISGGWVDKEGLSPLLCFVIARVCRCSVSVERDSYTSGKCCFPNPPGVPFRHSPNDLTQSGKGTN